MNDAWETRWTNGNNTRMYLSKALSRNLQIATATIDSAGMCLFIAFAILDIPDAFNALIDMINAQYGLSLTADDIIAPRIHGAGLLRDAARRILNDSEEFNRLIRELH